MKSRNLGLQSAGNVHCDVKATFSTHGSGCGGGPLVIWPAAAKGETSLQDQEDEEGLVSALAYTGDRADLFPHFGQRCGCYFS